MKEKISLIAFLSFLIIMIPIFSKGDFDDKPIVSSTYQIPGNQNLSKNYFRVYDSTQKKIVKIAYTDYIKGVVAAEMPASFHAEALKAQAVAAFSYAVCKKEAAAKTADPAHKDADVCTDPNHCKAFATKEALKTQWGENFDVYWNKISKAVDETAGKILVYDEEPVAAVFHSISGGSTENAKDVWGNEVPYLTAAESPGDKLAPGYEAAVTVTNDDIKKKVLENYPNAQFGTDPSKWFTEVKRSESGGVISASIGGVAVSGLKIREMFGLRSTNIEISHTTGGVTFHTKGYGHGVGLSQYGADYLARQGKTYGEILQWYYKGVEIKEYQESAA